VVEGVAEQVRVVQELVQDYVRPDVEAATLQYRHALVLMNENPGQWVEIQSASLGTREHKAMWDVLSKYHDVYDWVARYPEIGTCVLYARVPETVTKKVRKWFSK